MKTPLTYNKIGELQTFSVNLAKNYSTIGRLSIVGNMKTKTVWTVVVDDYFPQLCEITLPNIEAYAKRIGADFKLITERLNREYPPTYEKVQVWERGIDSDWNILVDADMLIHPSFWDVTEIVPQDSVGMYMAFDCSSLFPIEDDPYFKRDGRKLGVASNFLVVPDSCHDFWTPLNKPAAKVLPRLKRQFIVDEYCFSRNVASYGLKTAGIARPEKQELMHLDVTTSGDNKEKLLREAREFVAECGVATKWAWED